jgi:hypothetical protein
LHDPGSRPGQAFADKDLLQHINLARFLFGKVIPSCREARSGIEPLRGLNSGDIWLYPAFDSH